MEREAGLEWWICASGHFHIVPVDTHCLFTLDEVESLIARFEEALSYTKSEQAEAVTIALPLTHTVIATVERLSEVVAKLKLSIIDYRAEFPEGPLSSHDLLAPM